MKILQNKQGQALLETALVLPIVLMLLLGMLVIGIYIYDQTVFVYASNKGLDHGVGILTGAGLAEEQITEIQEKTKAAANLAIFTQGLEAFVTTTTTESEIILTVKIRADFAGNLPLINKITEVQAESSYVYKRE